jgi:Tfp pilus assembly protein PilF
MSATPRVTHRLAAALIAVLTIAVFANSLRNKFVNWDDPALVLENEDVKSLAPGHVLALFAPRLGETYQPLRVLSYAVDYKIWGENPFGYHLINTLLHGVAAFLFFLLCCELQLQIGKPEPLAENKSSQVRLVALAAALLFLLHPINVEAVVWISSRKYGLLAVFYLAAVLLYLRDHIGPAFACGMAAALSSPFAVSLPLVLMLLDYCRVPQLDPRCEVRKHWRRYLLFGVICLTVLPLLLGGSGLQTDVIKTHRGGLLGRFVAMWAVLFDSALNLAMPLWLNARYMDRSAELFSPKVLTAIFATGGLLWLGWKRLLAGDKRPMLALGWFALTWLPVSNLVVSISTTLADRYFYLPAMAVWLLLAGNALGGKSRSWQLPVVVVVLLTLSVLTWQRSRVWRDSVSLWQDSLDRDATNYLAHCNLGIAYYTNAEFAAAMPPLKEALAMNPSFLQARLHLARCYEELGQYAQAETHYRLVLESEETDDGLRGETLTNLGIIRGRTNDLSGAESLLRQALAIDAKYANAYNNLGNVLRLKGDLAGAEASYRNALKWDPEFVEAYFGLGTLLAARKRLLEARQTLEILIAKNPQHGGAYAELANICMALGDLAAAARYRSMSPR